MSDYLQSQHVWDRAAVHAYRVLIERSVESHVASMIALRQVGPREHEAHDVRFGIGPEWSQPITCPECLEEDRLLVGVHWYSMQWEGYMQGSSMSRWDGYIVVVCMSCEIEADFGRCWAVRDCSGNSPRITEEFITIPEGYDPDLERAQVVVSSEDGTARAACGDDRLPDDLGDARLLPRPVVVATEGCDCSGCRPDSEDAA